MFRTSIIIVRPGTHEITKTSDLFSRVSGVDWFVRVWPGGIHETSQLMANHVEGNTRTTVAFGKTKRDKINSNVYGRVGVVHVKKH